eukprot:SAG31_NODE_31889_length_362_cov_1.741445_1_plen_80_part_01
MLTFEQFETENNFDFVQIYDGNSAEAPKLTEGRGDSGGMEDLPSTTYVGTGQSMVIQFTSDGSVTQQGFTADLQCQRGGG